MQRAVPYLTLLLLAAIPGIAEPADAPPAFHGLMRDPDVSVDSIVFSYANDLWTVPRVGGLASPLASPDGPENTPRFSPDGGRIAFVGNYEGGRDIYTLPVGGGIPHRVTHHPTSERLSDWTPDGGILFAGYQVEGLSRVPDLYTVAATGGLPRALPMPYGDLGAISPDGTRIAYTPYSRDNRTWKRYRGGWASDIWILDLESGEAHRATDWEGTDSYPMWHGDTLYYLSDMGPEHRLNVWSYEPGSGRRRQVTSFTDFDVKTPAMGPGPSGRGEIVFQTGTGVHLLDLGTGRTRRVDIAIPGDRPSLAERSVDVARHIRSSTISPTGARVVVQARGDVWTLPAENGPPRNLTRTDWAAERDPSWSPDGRWIAYFTDASGEYELVVTQSDGAGETLALTSDGGPFKYAPRWSPDSERIVYSDKTGDTWVVEVEGGGRTLLDTDPWGSVIAASWSPASDWIAYARTEEDNPIRSVWLYEVATGERHRVTSPLFDDHSPAFAGDWLYLASHRVFTPTYSDLDTTFIYDDGQVLLAVPLSAETKSPWEPSSDEETWEEEAAEEEDQAEGTAGEAGDAVSGTWKGTAVSDEGEISFTLTLALGEGGAVNGTLVSDQGDGEVTGVWDPEGSLLTLRAVLHDGEVVEFVLELAAGSATGEAHSEGEAMSVSMQRRASTSGGSPAGDEGAAEEGTAIDLEGMERRALRLPVAAGAFGGLALNHKGQLMYARYSGGTPGIYSFDLADPDGGEKSVVSGATSFTVTADGQKMLVRRGNRMAIHPAGPGGGTDVPTGGMTARVDPRAEWTQMFNDAWRIYRDFFYVANMHGVDWEGMRERYGAMLPYLATREDLNFVIGELIAELNVGHAYRGGGDLEGQSFTSVGLLGADFALEQGAYRITAIHEGGPWDVDARGPLSQPGVDVEAGDWILAVDGVPLDTALDPWAAFVGKAGRATVLTVTSSPAEDGSERDVVVEPLGSDFGLRYRAWIERNRALVDEATGGRVGYVYVPNTGVGGQNDLFRQFFGQIGKEGLVIDERWNGGGQIPTRFIELLDRPVTNYWAVQDGNDWRWPPDSHQGPKVMLINGLAGSGGDMFPWLFRQAGLGPLVGTRTWGGLVGISGNPQLIDGGFIAVPTFGIYEKDGTWAVEGHGVDPDMEVLDDPSLMLDGGDPQLEAALEWILQAIEESPYEPPDRPADPDRSGMGLAEEDR